MAPAGGHRWRGRFAAGHCRTWRNCRDGVVVPIDCLLKARSTQEVRKNARGQIGWRGLEMRHLRQPFLPSDDFCTRLLHHFKGIFTPFGGHRSRPFLEKTNFETGPAGIDHRGEHTDLHGQPADPQPLHFVTPELLRETGLIENGLLVLIEADPFGNLYRIAGQLELRVEFRLVAVLDAMGRPLAPPAPQSSDGSLDANPVRRRRESISSPPTTASP
jgi:hypothetical protein